MSAAKTLAAQCALVSTASLLLVGGGWGQIAQVALSIIAGLFVLAIFVPPPEEKRGPVATLISRMVLVYVVAVSAYTGHLIIATVLAVSWLVIYAKAIQVKVSAKESDTDGLS